MDVPEGGACDEWMNEKNYWYAALENAEDDWFRGSIDLDVEERYRMW